MMRRRASLLAPLGIALAIVACRPPQSASPATAAAAPAVTAPPRFDFGRPATDDEIKAWDIDVRPDGLGLPAGSGTVAQGKIVYLTKCSPCHGPTGKEGPMDKLVGRDPREGFPFGRDPKLLPTRTIGNYWPYATTIYDYVNRAMPFTQPGTLKPDEVYAVTAYLLYLNEIVPESAVMDATTLPQVKMPAHDRFVLDNRQGGAGPLR